MRARIHKDQLLSKIIGAVSAWAIGLMKIEGGNLTVFLRDTLKDFVKRLSKSE